MKVITISINGNIECVLIVDDDDEDRILNMLADENDKLNPADRCHLNSQAPDTLENAIAYLRRV